MFERYTERARRVIFFARYEASQFGQTSIETPHLLLGLTREDKNLLARCAPRPWIWIENLRTEVQSKVEVGPKIPTSIDLPLSKECIRILAYAAEEAEMLGHRHIGTEHILLGILREENSMAAGILAARGLRLDAVRNELRTVRHSEPPADPATVSMGVGLGGSVNYKKLFEALNSQGFESSKDHLLRAVAAGSRGNWSAAQSELHLFFGSLVETIEKLPHGAAVVAPLIGEFDSKALLHDMRTDLPDAEDWAFRISFAMLLGELLFVRLEHGGTATQGEGMSKE